MNGLQVYKPLLGSIRDWKIIHVCPPTWEHNGTYIVGEFVGHPRFNGRRGHTSMVVSMKDTEGYWEIETLNSIYHLSYDEKEPDREFWNMSKCGM